MERLRLFQTTINLIEKEIDSIPDKYQKHLNSIHEGYGILAEEFKELEDEIFFGEKKCKNELFGSTGFEKDSYKQMHKDRIRKEAVQVAAMAIRIIQELT